MKPEDRTHQQFAADLSTLMTAFVGHEVRVDVSGWAGYYEESPAPDPPFEDPVYVIAEDHEENEYIDATCDLQSDEYVAQLAFVIEQLVHG